MAILIKKTRQTCSINWFEVLLYKADLKLPMNELTGILAAIGIPIVLLLGYWFSVFDTIKWFTPRSLVLRF